LEENRRRIGCESTLKDQSIRAPAESFISNVVKVPPYSGAKPYFLIEEQMEDRDWISSLIKLTAKELPKPKPKVISKS